MTLLFLHNDTSFPRMIAALFVRFVEAVVAVVEGDATVDSADVAVHELVLLSVQADGN